MATVFSFATIIAFTAHAQSSPPRCVDTGNSIDIQTPDGKPFHVQIPIGKELKQELFFSWAYSIDGTGCIEERPRKVCDRELKKRGLPPHRWKRTETCEHFVIPSNAGHDHRRENQRRGRRQ